MSLSILKPAIAYLKGALFICLFPLMAAAAPLEALWTMPSGSLGAGRVILSISTITVGTDGSVAFAVTTHDGNFVNQEYRLYWIDADQNDLADDGVPSNDWRNLPLEPLLVRRDQIVYLSNQQLRSMSRDQAGVITDVAVGSAFATANIINFMVEQSRNPGVLYLADYAESANNFNLHAYAINPVNNSEILVPTQVGIDNGDLKIVFATQTDGMYQIQASEDLVNWVDFQSVIVGTGLPQTFSEAISAATKKFYRVRKL